MEFIPYVGPIVGPIPAVLVALFTNPISAIWVVGLFVVLQQLEGHLVAPQVFRLSLRINPILVILSLLIGFHLYGIVGALLALPVASVIRQTVVYLRRHLVLEPVVDSNDAAGALRPAAVRPRRFRTCRARSEPAPPADLTPGQEPSALAGDPEESPDEEGGEQQQDDRDPGADDPSDRQHQRDHARDARSLSRTRTVR